MSAGGGHGGGGGSGGGGGGTWVGWAIIGMIVIFLLPQIFMKSRNVNENTSTSRTIDGGRTEVVTVGKDVVKVSVGEGACIHGGKNFKKIKVVSRDGPSSDLHEIGVVSKDGTDVPVTFIRYPISHEKCAKYRS